MFLQSVVNYQMVQMNGVEMEGLVDTGAAVSILSQKS
jgi:predicted aspartyl protease